MIVKYILLLIVFFFASFSSDIQAQDSLQADQQQFPTKKLPSEANKAAKLLLLSTSVQPTSIASGLSVR